MHGSWVAERGAGWGVGTPVDVPALQLLAEGYACVAQESRVNVTVTPASEPDGASVDTGNKNLGLNPSSRRTECIRCFCLPSPVSLSS